MPSRSAPPRTRNDLARGRPASLRRAALGLALLGTLLLTAACGSAGERSESPSSAGPAQPASGSAHRPWPHETSDLPLDPRVRLDALPNGLRLAWVDLADGSGSLQLALHLAAGSLAEQEHERGSSHLLEHLAFSAEHERSARWLADQPGLHGAHESTAAGWHECVFVLRTTGDVPQQLRDAGAWMQALLSPERPSPWALDAARAAVQQELTQRREAEDPRARALRSASAALVAGSRLSQRGPFDPDALPEVDAFVRWRERWLRPDLVTLVLVGDLGGADPVPALGEALGALPRPATPPADADPGPPVRLSAPYLAREVPELGALQLTVASLRPAPAPAPGRALLREDVPLGVALVLLQRNLGVVAGDALQGVSVRAVEGEAGLTGVSVSTQCAPGAWREALAVCRRVLDHALARGFPEAEVRALAGQAREALLAQGIRSPARWLDELLSTAAGATVPLTSEQVLALLGPVLDGLDGEACRAALARAWARGDLSIQALGPLPVDDGAGLVLRQAWEAAATPEWAYATEPAAAAGAAAVVVQRVHVPDLGVHQLRLANGVRVNLKRLPGTGAVRARAVVGEGQLALAPERAAVVFAAQQLGALESLGLRRHEAPELRRLLSARGVSYAVGSGEDAFVLDAAADPDELRLALELLAATLAEPAFDGRALAARRASLPGLYAGLASQPRGVLLSDVLPRLFSGDPRFGLPPQEQVAAVTLDDVIAWVAPQFADGPVELTVVGDFDLAAAEAALVASFGALPARRPSLRPYDKRRRVSLAEGLAEEHAVPGPASHDLLQVHLPTADGRDPGVRRRLSLLAVIVGGRLLEQLEPLLGEQGRLDVSSSASQVFPGLGDLVIEIEPPRGTGSVALETCLVTLERLAREGVSADELKAVLAPQLQAVQAQQATLPYWLGVLGRCQREPQRLDQARTLLADYRAIDAAALSALAAEVLDWSAASVVLVQAESSPEDNAP